MAMTGLNEQEALMGFNPKDALLSVVASAVLALTGAFVSVSADASPKKRRGVKRHLDGGIQRTVIAAGVVDSPD